MRLLVSEPTENHHDTALALIAYAAALRPEAIGVLGPPLWASLYQSLSEVSTFIPYKGRTCFDEVIKKMKAFRPTHILHATAYRREPLALAKAFPGTAQAGVIHNLAKLKRFSWLQWRMLGYLRFFWVLRPGLYERLPERYRARSDYLWVGAYPASLEAQIPPMVPEADRVGIAIPGRVEYKRRDYRMLLEVLERLRKRERFRFILLGASEGAYSDHVDFFRLVREKRREANFISFSEVVPFPLYHAYLRISCAVLPLIHPHRYAAHRVYIDEQISGSFPIAQAHRKPLFLHQSFAGERDLVDCSFFYDDADGLAYLLESMAEGRLEMHHLYRGGWYSFEEGIYRFRRGLEAA